MYAWLSEDCTVCIAISGIIWSNSQSTINPNPTTTALQFDSHVHFNTPWVFPLWAQHICDTRERGITMCVWRKSQVYVACWMQKSQSTRPSYYGWGEMEAGPASDALPPWMALQTWLLSCLLDRELLGWAGGELERYNSSSLVAGGRAFLADCLAEINRSYSEVCLGIRGQPGDKVCMGSRCVCTRSLSSMPYSIAHGGATWLTLVC